MTARRWEPITRQFRYIFYAFFQPARLEREFQPESLWQRFVFMLKLVVPIFLIAYLLTLVSDAILLPFDLLTPNFLLVSMVVIAVVIAVGIAGGVAVGIAVGIAGGVAVGIAFGIVVGIMVGIMGDMAVGIAFGIAVSIAFGIVVGIAFGIVGGVAVRIVVGIVGGIVVGIAGDIAFGIAFGIVGGIVFGIVFSIAGDIVRGIAGGIAFSIAGGIAFSIAGGITGGIEFGIVGGIGVILGVYRVPLYLISGPSILYTYFASWQQPRESLQLLRHSALHWDERVYLPLPFLKRTLLIASDQDLQETVTEIAFIAAERPQQLRAARMAILEIAMRDLGERKTVPQIAGAAQRLNELLPPETKLSDPRWANALSRLSDASREMMRCMQPIGQQARLKSLDKVIKNLDKIRRNVAFTDQGLNRRLKRVIETWRATAWMKREHLEHEAQDIGNIDNPYKPGQVLEPDDPLFVGRRDLAVQLEYALSKGNRRPTLLLQGERRMGKTSTLCQLSYLLGTSYVPIVYNLQDPKIYERTSTFLGTLASGIYDELLKRGIAVRSVPAERLLEVSYDPKVYGIFDGWLKGVETVLEKEERSLLLAFDEFEKLDEAGEKGYLDLRLFLDWCRQVIQYRPRVILLFSGVRTFRDMGARSGLNWSNYFVNVQTLKVSFLNSEEARQLILHPKPGYPGEVIFGTVAEQITQQTNCHPFLVQALCSQLIDTLNVEKRERVETVDMAPVVKQVIESWNGYFDDLWKRCDELQRACLLALDAQEGEEGMTVDEIRRHSQLDEKSVRQVLRVLVSRDLVVDKDDGTYCIAAPIFRRWVKANS